jgi:hypothetical protein
MDASLSLDFALWDESFETTENGFDQSDNNNGYVDSNFRTEEGREFYHENNGGGLSYNEGGVVSPFSDPIVQGQANLDTALSNSMTYVGPPSSYGTHYPHTLSIDSSQTLPSNTSHTSLYMHHQVNPTPMQDHSTYSYGKTDTTSGNGLIGEYEQVNSNPKKSIPIVTLNTNNFDGIPSQLRYLQGEPSRKRPSALPETEMDNLNAKRIKNREAARRWRQGKKDQIADLQGEVHTLRTKLDTLQTEMETLRIENQYLKHELHKARHSPAGDSPPSSSPPKPTAPYLNTHTIFSHAPSASTFAPADINFLPTPSLFLLCLFVFSLCLSFPAQTHTPFPGTHTVSPLENTSRQPRLFHAVDQTAMMLEEKILSGKSYTGTNWVYSMVSAMYNHLVPMGNSHTRNDHTSILGILKTRPGDMNKKLSRSLRLDGFL